MKSIVRALFGFSFSALVTACAAQSVESRAFTQQGTIGQQSLQRTACAESSTRMRVRATPQWGVGFDTLAKLYDGHAAFTKLFCQDPGYRYPTCPAVLYGNRAGHYSTSKRLSNSVYVTVSLQVSGVSQLGEEPFSQTEAGSSAYASSPIFAVDSSNLGWDDELTPTSKTLPPGTAVAFQVTLTVTPTTVNAPCDYYFSNPHLQ